MKVAQAHLIVEFVNEIREEDEAIGGEKLWIMYNQKIEGQYKIGRDAFYNILKQNGLNLRKPRKSCRTTDSSHGLKVYKDLTKNMALTKSNLVWVSDITYIHLSNRFCYLSLITDAYNRKIIGAFVGESLAAKDTLVALKQAISKCSNDELSNIIHHSDRGVQYASSDYITELQSNGMRVSMTESGDPKDNAIAERVNGILKKEFLNRYEFETIQEVRDAVEAAVDFYNNKRPHRSLDMMTPEQASQKTGIIRKRWISYKDKYINESNIL